MYSIAWMQDFSFVSCLNQHWGLTDFIPWCDVFAAALPADSSEKRFVWHHWDSLQIKNWHVIYNDFILGLDRCFPHFDPQHLSSIKSKIIYIYLRLYVTQLCTFKPYLNILKIWKIIEAYECFICKYSKLSIYIYN